MNKTIITAVTVAVILGGASFWGGMTYAESSAQSTRAQFAGAGGGAGRTGGRFGGGGGGAFGTIIAKDATSITVQLMGGPNATSTGQTGTGSKIVFFSNATQIGKMVTGSSSDLAVGTSITVGGTANSDGSVTATSIQIRPAGTSGRGGQ